MHRLSTTSRITIGLVLLSISTLLLARTMRIGPNERLATLEGRRVFCEALAMNGSMLLSRDEVNALKALLTAVVDRYPEVLSAGVRQGNGRLVIQMGDHQRQWAGTDTAPTTGTQVLVPLIQGAKEWGTLEVRFQPAGGLGLIDHLKDPFMQLVFFLGLVNLIAFFLYLKKTLQHLDPSRVVPNRVRNALDTMAGGLVILDNQQHIVLANTAFSKSVCMEQDELQGTEISKLSWLSDSGHGPNQLPWDAPLEGGEANTGETVQLLDRRNNLHTYIVNCSAVVGDDGQRRGVLASFEDVTELENKRTELSRTLKVLRTSRDEIREKNQELQRLATEDPLTGCVNRRSFFETLEAAWKASRRDDGLLGCIMLDIDHFKMVNDTHGHSVGDLVLKTVAIAVRESIGDGNTICRYGGEEFCVLLPHLGIEQSASVAERIRAAVENLTLPGFSVTISSGATCASFGAKGPQEMIEQADRALYAAKHQGRNRVIRWDTMPDDVAERRSKADPAVDSKYSDRDEMLENEVPFHAVSALMSAMAYRDAATAEHSRRVADLCVAVARDMLPARECYILEIAALLHDIGKIGVPDSILLKPGPLTDAEWKIMDTHDRVGVEIVAAAFSCPSLANLIQNHQAWYTGHPREPGLPTGTDIPLGARILALADAYDAMTSDNVYRSARDRQAAFAELRRCAGTQFDPDLVEPFIAAVENRFEFRTHSPHQISREAAVSFGQQMERLADALDHQDVSGLAVVADKLNRTAKHVGETELAEIAAALQAAANNPDSELIEIVRITNQLLGLCRETQVAFLDSIMDTEATAS